MDDILSYIWNFIDKQEVIPKLRDILLIIIGMYLVIKIGNKIINNFIKRQIKLKNRFSMDEQKAKTIGAILKSVLKYLTYFLGGALIIGTIFSGVSVAVAGLGSVAIGFGAQDLVKDIINGFFIIFEDQFGIGDHVTLCDHEGIIETIGIRTTFVRDFNGDLHMIPNSSIKEVTNHSRGNIRFMVSVDIAYEEDIDNALACIDKVCKDFTKNHEEVTDPITVLGVTELKDSGVSITVMGKSKPLSQWNMERELRKDIKLALDANEIEIPYNKTEITISKK